MSLNSKSDYVYDPDAHIYKYLSKDTGGSQSLANINVIGDYGSPTKFFITPPEGEIWVLNRMLVAVRDSGSFDSGAYGNGITLTNGIKIYRARGEEIIDITGANPVKQNPDWGVLCYDTVISSYGSGNETLNARWTFSKSGLPFSLDGDEGDSFGMTFEDDFSNLVSQFFFVQGFKLIK